MEPSISDNGQPATDESAIQSQATPEIQETFKEHYPLLLPFSYAAIVEDEKKEVKYSIF